MAIIIQKFGGTSLANIEKIKHVAEIIAKEKKRNTHLVVIVSAMAGVTDQLAKLATDISSLKDNQEFRAYDQIVSSGEQIAAGLLSLALQNLNLNSVSYLGWQLPILTDSNHGKAEIISVNIDKIKSAFIEDKIVVISGFQGINKDGDITTLGRGGSDTSAVAVSIAMNADRCDIYTDVDGIYTADPNIIKDAIKYDKISYDQIFEMSRFGAKVIENRSVYLAMKHNLNMNILSSSNKKTGTNISTRGEYNNYNAIVNKPNQVLLTINNINNTKILFDLLVTENIEVMQCNNSKDQINENNVIFLIDKINLNKVIFIIEKNQQNIIYKNYKYQNNIEKISLISNNKITDYDKMLINKTIDEHKINIYFKDYSDFRISILIDIYQRDITMNNLHKLFIKKKILEY